MSAPDSTSRRTNGATGAADVSSISSWPLFGLTDSTSGRRRSASSAGREARAGDGDGARGSVAEVVGWARRDQAAVTDHADAVTHALRFVEVVGGDEDGDVLPAGEVEQVGAEPGRGHRVEARGGLVEEDHGRPMEERAPRVPPSASCPGSRFRPARRDGRRDRSDRAARRSARRVRRRECATTYRSTRGCRTPTGARRARRAPAARRTAVVRPRLRASGRDRARSRDRRWARAGRAGAGWWWSCPRRSAPRSRRRSPRARRGRRHQRR